MDKILTEYKNRLIQKRYSQNTINIYCKYFQDFCNHFQHDCLSQVNKDQINIYILELVKRQEISTSQQNQRINAIKFYYEKILGREKQYYDIHRPRSENRLPKVLSKSDVRKIFESCGNIKHKCILMLIYSAGLRRSELLDLTIADIDSERMVINIRGGKGQKDRISLLSKNTLMLLRNYYKEYKPEEYLFSGQKGGKYSATSVANILNKLHEEQVYRKI